MMKMKKMKTAKMKLRTETVKLFARDLHVVGGGTTGAGTGPSQRTDCFVCDADVGTSVNTNGCPISAALCSALTCNPGA